MRAVLADIGVDAVKVGMLGTRARHARGRRVPWTSCRPAPPSCVDPVMVAESGARLLDPDAQRASVQEILPRATVLTPNLPEARVLAGWADAPGAQRPAAIERGAPGPGPASGADEERKPRRSRARCSRSVRAPSCSPAAIARARRTCSSTRLMRGARSSIEGVRHPDGAAHGSGCTHSSVLAAQFALGRSLLGAARIARALAGEAVANGLRELGAGAGPVDVIGLARMRSD